VKQGYSVSGFFKKGNEEKKKPISDEELAGRENSLLFSQQWNI
jgi:hypothetical protein